MKKSRGVVIVAVLLLIAFAVFAQSHPSHKPQQQPGSAMTTCPMMGMMGNAKPGKAMTGNMQEMMNGMSQRMAGHFFLSGEKIAARLTEKKTELGLSEVQVKQVADLIASSEQEKIKDQMQGMMSRMQAGQMKCPCMQSATK